MGFTVFRSLDKPASFFGIRGRFMVWMVMGLGVDLLVSCFVGFLTAGLLGVVVFVALALLIYMYILGIQGRLTPRQLTKKMDSRRLASYVRMRPVSISSMLSSGKGRRRSFPAV